MKSPNVKASQRNMARCEISNLISTYFQSSGQAIQWYTLSDKHCTVVLNSEYENRSQNRTSTRGLNASHMNKRFILCRKGTYQVISTVPEGCVCGVELSRYHCNGPEYTWLELATWNFTLFTKSRFRVLQKWKIKS